MIEINFNWEEMNLLAQIIATVPPISRNFIGVNSKYTGYYSSDNQSLLNEDLIDPLLGLIESTQECM